MKTRYKMFSTILLAIVLSFSGCGGGGSSSSNSQPTEQNGLVGFTGDGDIKSIIEETISQNNIPAMAVLTVDQNSVLEKEVFGKKVFGEDTNVSLDELWNIGSITKSMTSTLAAIMVEQNYISWDTTLLELFPEFENSMQDRYKNITLVQLLSHTSGLPADNDELWQEFVDDEDDLTLQRYEFTNDALEYESEFAQGEYLYSNVGYVVAAAMLEKSSGLSYETLIQGLLFDNLDMNKTQIGIQNLDENVSGHIFEDNTWKVKKAQVIDSSNVGIVAPAGSRTYVSLDDMAKYLQLHLKGKLGETNPLVDDESFKKLHTKVVMADEDLGYALGWFTESDYGLQHSGSNGRWYALSFINAQKGYGYFVVINGYKAGIESSVYEMMQKLVERSDALN